MKRIIIYLVALGAIIASNAFAQKQAVDAFIFDANETLSVKKFNVHSNTQFYNRTLTQVKSGTEINIPGLSPSIVVGLYVIDRDKINRRFF